TPFPGTLRGERLPNTPGQDRRLGAVRKPLRPRDMRRRRCHRHVPDQNQRLLLSRSPPPDPSPPPAPTPPPLPLPSPPPNPVPFDGGWRIAARGLPILDVGGTVSAGGPA